MRPLDIEVRIDTIVKAREEGLMEVAARARRISTDKGFDLPNWDTNFPTKTLLVITELDEAVQFIDGHGKDPVEIELADAAIRIMSTLEGIWQGEWSASRVETRIMPVRPDRRVGLYAPLQVSVWPIIRNLCKATESWRKSAPGDDTSIHKTDAKICMELALLETFRLADKIGVNLRSLIDAKCDRNEQRPMFHNKGRSAG